MLEVKKKEIIYKRPNVIIAEGKWGPIELVIWKDGLYALKRLCKETLDSDKRIEHAKNEKKMLKKCSDCPFVIQLRETFTDKNSICFLFEYQPG